MDCDNTPPSPQGMIHRPDSERFGVSPYAVDAYRAALAHARTLAVSPSSNTGMILATSARSASADAPAFVDYLKFTLRGLRRVLERVRRQDVRTSPADGLSELREILGCVSQDAEFSTRSERENAGRLLDACEVSSRVTYEPLEGRALDRGLAMVARIAVQCCAPALVFGELTGRGRDGYRDHLVIYTHLGQNCGFIAVGGNNETVHVNLTGQACARIDMRKLAESISVFDHKIGRIDVAWDDFEGRYGPASGARENFLHGGFTPERGQRSEKVIFYDDMGCGGGSSFQLGDRASRMLRIYEKGKQLGDKESLWVRYEVQYMAAAFDLTLDNLRNPGMLLLQYPDLDFLPVIAAGDHCARVRKETEVHLDKLVNWLRVVAGPILTLCADTIGATTVIDLVESEKTPRRLRGVANSRQELGNLIADVLLDSRKFAPVARSRSYQSAFTREKTS